MERRRAIGVLGSVAAGPVLMPSRTFAELLAWSERARASSTGPHVSSLLTPPRARAMTALAEVIIPATDTPGASEAGVTEFRGRARGRLARRRRTQAETVTADFFAWATGTDRRFTAVVGNPPSIRYQRFSGRRRRRALEFCAAHGVRLSGLCSSWAPFVVGASRLLVPGGRLAFVVPAEIGHAVYARDVVRYLLRSFARVEVVAVREKLFPDLSEDCWLLRASGFGGRSNAIHFVRLDSFGLRDGSWVFEPVSVDDLDRWDYRLRAFLVPSAIRSAYQEIAVQAAARRLGNVARVGIGYVTGANDFFHLRPSDAPTILLRSLIFASRTVATMCRMLPCSAAARLRNPFAATGAPWSGCPTGKTSEIIHQGTRRAV